MTKEKNRNEWFPLTDKIQHGKSYQSSIEDEYIEDFCKLSFLKKVQDENLDLTVWEKGYIQNKISGLKHSELENTHYMVWKIKKNISLEDSKTLNKLKRRLKDDEYRIEPKDYNNINLDRSSTEKDLLRSIGMLGKNENPSDNPTFTWKPIQYKTTSNFSHSTYWCATGLQLVDYHTPKNQELNMSKSMFIFKWWRTKLEETNPDKEIPTVSLVRGDDIVKDIFENYFDYQGYYSSDLMNGEFDLYKRNLEVSDEDDTQTKGHLKLVKEVS